MNQRLLLGTHISIAGGMEKAFERAESIHCTCMQIFTKSNRQWHAKPLSTIDIDRFIQRMHNSPINPVIAHASYLINVGSSSIKVEKKSIAALLIELQRCYNLEIPYLVLHPGAYRDSNITTCIKKIADNLNFVLNKAPGKTMVLLENMAGQGTVIGYTLEQLAQIYEKSSFKNRLGFCIDTCHAFAAGYDLQNKLAYEKFWQHFDDTLNLSNLKVIHVNDSIKQLGSRIDRHTHIGSGTLTTQAFQLLFNDERFFNMPKILETPKENGLLADANNIHFIKNLLTPKTRKILNL